MRYLSCHFSYFSYCLFYYAAAVHVVVITKLYGIEGVSHCWPHRNIIKYYFNILHNIIIFIHTILFTQNYLEGRVITVNTDYNQYSGHSNPAYVITTQQNPTVTVNTGYSASPQQYGYPDPVFNSQAYPSVPQPYQQYNTTVGQPGSVLGQPPQYKY